MLVIYCVNTTIFFLFLSRLVFGWRRKIFIVGNLFITSLDSVQIFVFHKSELSYPYVIFARIGWTFPYQKVIIADHKKSNLRSQVVHPFARFFSKERKLLWNEDLLATFSGIHRYSTKSSNVYKGSFRNLAVLTVARFQPARLGLGLRMLLTNQARREYFVKVSIKSFLVQRYVSAPIWQFLFM